MRVSLLAAALLVGLANAALYSLVSDNTFEGLLQPRLEPWPLLALYALCAVFVGLLISGALLGFAERDLRGTFFARYGLMVLAVCVGGAVLAPLLTWVTLVFDREAYKPASTRELLSTISFSALPGGVLGAAEGVVLGFPLSGLLGFFGQRTDAPGGASS